MLDAIADRLAQGLRVFRRTAPFPVEILLPGLLILFAWPLLRVWLNDEATTFMVAFVLAMGLRLAMKSERIIRRTRAQFSGKATVILVLLCGPGVLALLIWQAEPLLCQRFLTFYFLIAAALYIIDVVDGNYAIVGYRWPAPQMRPSDAILTRAMAVYNLAMVLANETLIHQASQTTWLLYFGLLPVLSNIIRKALVRTIIESRLGSEIR